MTYHEPLHLDPTGTRIVDSSSGEVFELSKHVRAIGELATKLPKLRENMVQRGYPLEVYSDTFRRVLLEPEELDKLLRELVNGLTLDEFDTGKNHICPFAWCWECWMARRRQRVWLATIPYQGNKTQRRRAKREATKAERERRRRRMVWKKRT